MSAPPTATLLQRDVQQMIAWAQDAVDIAKTLHAQNPALYDQLRQLPLATCCRWCAPTARWTCTTACCARATPTARMLFDGASDQGYLDLIEEEVKPWTYMKFPFLKSLGREHGWYRVGPLARVQNCDFIPSPLAEAQRREFVAWGQGQPVHAHAGLPLGAHDRDAALHGGHRRAAGRPGHPGRRADGRRASAGAAAWA